MKEETNTPMNIRGMLLARHNVKDSVFTHLFRDPVYTLALYRVLHPEDTTATESDIDIVTLENIFLNQPYNDLGFTVGNRLLILVEAQSTWTVNILVRMLMYVAQSIQTCIIDSRQNVYGSKKIDFPKPELYVLYTGDRMERPEMLSLTQEFFAGRDSDLELKVHVLYDGEEGDIVYQYVAFTRIYNEQVKCYGRTQKAVLETIRICRNRNILRSYLTSREKEVIDIMMTLFDYENVLNLYVFDKEKDARAEGRNSTFFELVRDGILSSKDAADRVHLTETAFLDQMNTYYSNQSAQATT